MIDLYQLTKGKEVYTEEAGERMDIESLDIHYNKVNGWYYEVKINGTRYVVNMTDDECKIIVTDKLHTEAK